MVALGFRNSARSLIEDMGLKPLDLDDLVRIVELWDPLKQRTAAAKQARSVQRLGSIIMLAGPVLMLLTRNPMIMAADMAAGALILGSNVVMHILTLPVEYDASFRRALPVLKKDGYLRPEHLPAARQILKAAALTYVAAAGMTLLDVARWLRVLRF